MRLPQAGVAPVAMQKVSGAWIAPLIYRRCVTPLGFDELARLESAIAQLFAGHHISKLLDVFRGFQPDRRRLLQDYVSTVDASGVEERGSGSGCIVARSMADHCCRASVPVSHSLHRCSLRLEHHH